MAADFIKIDRRQVHGDRVVTVADRLIEIRTGIESEYQSASRMHGDDNYTMLEGYFGLEAGTGSAFMTLLTNLREILIGTKTLPGTQRKDQLDEFSARIGGQ